MAILPLDMQAILLRMDNQSKVQQQQEGVVAAQMLKGAELSELAQLESSRVNEVRPHLDENTKIEDKEQERKSELREREREKEAAKKKYKKKDFDDPFKGTIIDTVR
jgi:hypothetical protein